MVIEEGLGLVMRAWNRSSNSKVLSPRTLTVKGLTDSPGAKVTVPDGNVLPTKSLPSTPKKVLNRPIHT